jgi:phage terminase large subunit
VKIRYKPRDQFRPFHSRKQRWSALVCHRRAGKTVATLNDLIRGAVNECKHEGRYAFIFPQRNQAKDTAWRYLRRYAEPLLAKPPNESDLRVDLVNGSMIVSTGLTILTRCAVHIWMVWSWTSSPI